VIAKPIKQALNYFQLLVIQLTKFLTISSEKCTSHLLILVFTDQVRDCRIEMTSQLAKKVK